MSRLTCCLPDSSRHRTRLPTLDARRARSGTGFRLPSRIEPEALARSLVALRPRWGLLLDHDGTLSPFRRDPARARPSRHVLRVLARLVRGGAPVAVVSGRSLAFLRRAFPVAGLDLAGNHGASTALFDEGGRSVGTSATMEVRWRSAARRLEVRLRHALRDAPPGLLIERKPLGVAVHARPLRAPLRGIWLDTAAAGLLRELPPDFEMLRGNLVVEARPRGLDKGVAVREFVRRSVRWRRPLVAVGDDETDEDMFGALGTEDVGVLVSRTPRLSAAPYRLRTVGEVLRFLRAMSGGMRGG